MLTLVILDFHAMLKFLDLNSFNFFRSKRYKIYFSEKLDAHNQDDQVEDHFHPIETKK